MTKPNPFKTEIFTTSPGVYLRCLLGMWFRNYGLWIALPLIVSTVLGFTVDMRWIIVTMMLIFIVIPMLLAYLYFYNMLTPEARRTVMPKSVEIQPDGSVTVKYENGKDEMFPPQDIASFGKWSKYLAIVLKSERLSFILVPRSLIE